MTTAETISAARPDPFAEHGRTPPGYRTRRGPVAGDAIEQPPANPPLGALAGDELLDLDHVDRVIEAHGITSALGLAEAVRLGLRCPVERDAQVARPLTALHAGREARRKRAA